MNDKGRKKALSVLLMGALLFCVVAIVSAPCGAQTPTPAEEFPKEAAAGTVIGAIIAILAIFVFLVYLGYRADKDFKTGEFRRAVAGAFVVGFSIIAILSFVFGILRDLIIPAYIELVGIIIGFYFGQRAAEIAFEMERKRGSQEQKGGAQGAGKT